MVYLTIRCPSNSCNALTYAEVTDEFALKFTAESPLIKSKWECPVCLELVRQSVTVGYNVYPNELLATVVAIETELCICNGLLSGEMKIF